jgi:hypothetical protein
MLDRIAARHFASDHEIDSKTIVIAPTQDKKRERWQEFVDLSPLGLGNGRATWRDSRLGGLL